MRSTSQQRGTWYRSPNKRGDVPLESISEAYFALVSALLAPASSGMTIRDARAYAKSLEAWLGTKPRASQRVLRVVR